MGLKLLVSQIQDFFGGRLDQMIDLRHPQAVLFTHMPWQEIEASQAGLIARKVNAGRKIEDDHLFGLVVQVSSGGVSNASRLSREIARKVNLVIEAVQEALMQPIGRANRILLDISSSRAKTPKAPGFTVCIAKGKTKSDYESSAKARIALTARHNLTVGAWFRFRTILLMVHTLAKQLEQAMILMQDVAISQEKVHADSGNRLRKEDSLPMRTLLP